MAPTSTSAQSNTKYSGLDFGFKNSSSNNNTKNDSNSQGIPPQSAFHKLYPQQHLFGRSAKAADAVKSKNSTNSPLSKLQLDTNLKSSLNSSPLSGDSDLTAFTTHSSVNGDHQTTYYPFNNTNQILYKNNTNPESFKQSRKHPPSFRSSNSATPSPHSLKRAQRNIPTFNVLTVGPTRTGKTSFLKTLLTSIVPNTVSTSFSNKELLEQIASFGCSRPQPLSSHYNAIDSSELPQTDTITLDILEQGRKVKLSVIDTPGIVPDDNDKIKTQVIQLINFIESRFEETLSWETKVDRSSKKAIDAHVHLVLYFLNPETLVANMNAQKSHDVNGHHKNVDQLEDIQIMKELSKRVNILPVIGRADELTDVQYNLVKHLVRNAMHQAGISTDAFDDPIIGNIRSRANKRVNGSTVPRKALSAEDANGHDDDEQDEDLDSDPASPSEDVPTRVVKVNTKRLSMMSIRRPRASSRVKEMPSLRELRGEQQPSQQPQQVEISDAEADDDDHRHHIPSLREFIPFTIITPDSFDKSNENFDILIGEDRSSSQQHHQQSEENFSVMTHDDSLSAPTRDRVNSISSAASSARQLRRQPSKPRMPPGTSQKLHFVRTFRFGQANVLDPNHCDFTVLKSFMFSEKMDSLKDWTTQKFYEEYRTERLLRARKLKQQSQYIPDQN